MYIININSFLNNELDYNTNKVVLSDIIYLVHILYLSMTSGTSMYIYKIYYRSHCQIFAKKFTLFRMVIGQKCLQSQSLSLKLYV